MPHCLRKEVNGRKRGACALHIPSSAPTIRLTASLPYSLPSIQLKEIIEKDAMGDELKRLLTAYPPSCIHADVSSLRKMIALERQR